MAKQKQKAGAPIRGAPKKKAAEKIGNNHLRQDQTERMKDLTIERGVPFVVILREAVDFYLQALDGGEQKGDAS